MARIGDVWDSTTDVLAGRTSLLAAFAGGALFLPAALQAAVRAFTARPASGMSVATAVVVVVVAVIALWARLAITAVALHPETNGGQAQVQAARRLLPMIGALLVLAAAGIVLLIPILVVLTRAGLDWTALGAGGRASLPVLTGGSMWFMRLYLPALVVLALWVVARVKLLLGPVVLEERRVIGAIGRAAALTRGMTWKLIGVILLYYVVLWVCVLAATALSGLLFRLLLGSGAWTGFLATIVGAAVGVTLDTVAQVFGARLYAATAATGGGEARAPA